MTSKVSVYRREAQKILEDLEEAELRVARDFLEYLRSMKLNKATREVLKNPKLMKDIRSALVDRRSGR